MFCYPYHGRLLAEIASKIDMGLTVRPSVALLTGLLKRFMYDGFIHQIHDADKNFLADERCTSCGICAAICPVHNSDLVDGMPVWQHHCELCCTCIHLCPVEAIQYGYKTKNRGRYRHPDLKITDMKAQRGE